MANEYVLVHGAFHGAWCWDQVAARLRAKGHRVVTLDLPGHGRRAAEVRRAGMEAYGRAVPPPKAAEYAARLGVKPVDMDCAHDPMLSRPGELARILEKT